MAQSSQRAASSPLLLFALVLILATCGHHSFLVSATSLQDGDTATVRGMNCKRRSNVEHLYYDATTAPDAKTGVVAPVMLKLKCKGAGCPAVHGATVRLTGLPPSNGIPDVTAVAEETSGWILLWHDKKMTQPVRADTPTGRDIYVTNKGTLWSECL